MRIVIFTIEMIKGRKAFARVRDKGYPGTRCAGICQIPGIQDSAEGETDTGG